MVFKDKTDTLRSNYVLVKKTSIRKNIKKGDLISFDPSTTKFSKLSNFIIVKSGNRNIAGANIYFNNKWIGQTDGNGISYLSTETVDRKGLLKVIKAGFNDYTRPVYLRKSKNVTVKIKKAESQIYVESEPSRAKVYIDSKYIGRTPLNANLKASNEFIKLEVVSGTDYQKFSKIIDRSEDNLILTGENKVVLYKDKLRLANIEFKNKKFNNYLSILGSIQKEHPDYLEAQHLIGEMLLFKLNRPKDALIAFNSVTDNKEVKEFINKKFIKTHILEGIAYYNIFSKQKNVNDYSTKLLQKSIDKLNEVKPYIRYVNSKEYDYLVETTYFYKALSFQKLYSITNDKRFMEFTLKSWDDFFTNTKEKNNSYHQKAMIYNKQIIAMKKNHRNKKL